MALIDTLSGAGVAAADARASYGWTLFTPADVLPFKQRRLFDQDGAPEDSDRPLVSCLMVTTGERFSIRYALECYRRQLYENREMVIVTYLDRVQAVRDLAAAAGVANVGVHGVGRDLALGEMRNVSVGRARGEILIQWDDGDLCDPARVSAAAMLLTQSVAAAALLWRVLIWWPERALAAISANRLWAPSIAVWRAHAPVYPGLDRTEAAQAVAFLTSTRETIGCDAPLLYVHVAHGGDRFEQHLREATCVLRGADYEELIQLLAERMPIADYRAEALHWAP